MADGALPNEDDVRRASDLIDAERYEEAFALLEPIAQVGDARGQLLLGWMREVGRGCDRDYVAAERWYGASADQQYAPAQFYLGSFYHRRGQRDRAAFYFERAEEQDFLPAYYCLAGDRLKRGNREEALRLLEQGKQKGHLPSALALIGLVVRGWEHGLVEKLTAIMRTPAAALRFFGIYMTRSNDERVLR